MICRPIGTDARERIDKECRCSESSVGSRASAMVCVQHIRSKPSFDTSIPHPGEEERSLVVADSAPRHSSDRRQSCRIDRSSRAIRYSAKSTALPDETAVTMTQRDSGANCSSTGRGFTVARDADAVSPDHFGSLVCFPRDEAIASRFASSAFCTTM